MKPIDHWLQRAATKKNILLALVISALLTIPYLVSFNNLTAKGPLLDQMFRFNVTNVHQTLESYGTAGRMQYVWAEIIDVVFVLLVALTIALVIKYAFGKQSWGTKLAIIPLVAGALNSVKVACVISLILSYSRQLPMLVEVTSVVNTLKTVAIAASVILLLVAIIMIVVSRLKPKEAI